MQFYFMVSRIIPKNIDIWIAVDETNATRIVKALDQFGFASPVLKESDFLMPDQIIQPGYSPNCIDLINTNPGVDFETCYAARIQTEIDGVLVNFINLENPKSNKKAFGRHRDLADIESLE